MRLAFLGLLAASCATHESMLSLPGHLVPAEQWELDLGWNAADSELANMCVWRERESVQGHAVWQLVCNSGLHEDLVLLSRGLERHSDEVVLLANEWSRYDFTFANEKRAYHAGFRFVGAQSGTVYSLVGPHFDPGELAMELPMDLEVVGIESLYSPKVSARVSIVDSQSIAELEVREVFYSYDDEIISRKPFLKEEWLLQGEWSDVYLREICRLYARGIASRKVTVPLSTVDETEVSAYPPGACSFTRIWIPATEGGARRLSNRIEFPARLRCAERPCPWCGKGGRTEEVEAP